MNNNSISLKISPDVVQTLYACLHSVVTCSPAVTFHDDLTAPTVHCGSNPRWLRPCGSAEEVPARRNPREYMQFPREPSHQIRHEGRWRAADDRTTPVIDTCGRCVAWLWQTVRVKMGLVSSTFP